MTDTYSYRLSLEPLDRTQADELIAELSLKKHDGFTVRDRSTRFRGSDPTNLVAIITISDAAIAAVAAFLMKRRRHGAVSYELTVERADGTRLHEVITLDERSSDAPDPELVRELRELLRGPLSDG
jgi:hypothetical protein